jgi:hypothetical protein
MIGFIGFLFVIGATLFLSYIYDIFQGPKFRLHLPMVGGLVLALFLTLFFLLDPYYSPGLSEFALGNQFLLLPFVILAPLPYVEQWAGIVLQKRYIFFTSVLTTDFFVYFHGIPEAGRFLFSQYWQVEGLFWTLCMIAPALGIFLVSSRCQRFFSRRARDAPPAPAPGSELEMTPGKMRFIVVLIAAFLIFWISLSTIGSMDDETAGGFEIATLNQSQVANNSVRHLTDQDFRYFPRMAPVIRDNRTVPGNCHSYLLRDKLNTCVWYGGFRYRDGSRFREYEGSILEYQGRYYIMAQTYLV